jgi:cytochrome b involved in lipid metabolism
LLPHPTEFNVNSGVPLAIGGFTAPSGAVAGDLSQVSQWNLGIDGSDLVFNVNSFYTEEIGGANVRMNNFVAGEGLSVSTISNTDITNAVKAVRQSSPKIIFTFMEADNTVIPGTRATNTTYDGDFEKNSFIFRHSNEQALYFHHKFQLDYRNGIRWYHWDPTKWTIQLAALIGLARKLKTVQFSEILRARLEVESINFKNSNFYKEKLEPLSTRLVESQAQFEKLKKEYSVAKDQKVLELRAELELLNIEIDSMKRKWKILIKSAQLNN